MNEKLNEQDLLKLLKIYQDGEKYILLRYEIGIHSGGTVEIGWVGYRNDVGHTKHWPTQEGAIADLLGMIAAKKEEVRSES